ncbi:MAG: PAS domain-containing sensor histidine kinase [Candidatus Micrarchaeota archaeon]|nr:PAS domain-containing sensor histidine kinase [Candidatus Micrarchaeota archaeon]
MRILTIEEKKIITPLFKSIVEKIPIGIGVIDKSGDLVLTNKKMKRIFLYFGQKTNLNVRLVEEELLQKIINDIWTGKESIIDLEFNIKGIIKNFKAITVPITNEKKEISFVMLILHERTKEIQDIKRLSIAKEVMKTAKLIDIALEGKEEVDEMLESLVAVFRKNPYLGCVHILKYGENPKLYYYSSTGQSKSEIFSYYKKFHLKKDMLIVHDITKGEYSQHRETTVRSHFGLILKLKYRNKDYGILTLHFKPDVKLFLDAVKAFKEIASNISKMIYSKEIEKIEIERLKELKRMDIGFKASAVCRLLVKYENKEPKIIKVNDAFKKLYGYSEKEVIGKNPRILKSGLIPKAKYKEMWRSILDKNIRHWEGEIVNKRKNGELITVKLIIDTIFENGEPKYFFANHVDITEQMRLLHEINKQNEKLAAILNSSLDAIIVGDRKLRFEMVNTSFEKMTGYSASEIIGKDIHDLLMAKKDINKKRLKKFKKTGKIDILGKQVETEIITKDKKIIPVELSVNKFKIDNDEKLVAIMRNIAERKRLENEIIAKEKFYQEIFEHSDDGIIVAYYDSKIGDFIIKDINKRACEISKVRKEEAIGKAAREIFKGIEKIGLYQKARAGIQSGKAEYLHDVFYSDGRISGWRDYYIFRLTTDEVVVMYRDITERKEMEKLKENYRIKLEQEVKEKTQQINQQLEQIEQLQKAKDEFIRNMTHELKTPTSVILTNLEMLKQMAPIGKEKEWLKMIEMLHRNAERLKNSIDQILNLTRLSAIQLNKERIILDDIVNQVYNDYSPLMMKKGLQFKKDVEPIVIMADKNLLILLLSNLVSNAIKFTNEGEIKLEAKSYDHTIMIAVEDTGIGMTEEERSHIFEKFYKADPNSPGTGIGLTIVKEIVEKHGGKIEVKSQKGKGTRFEIYLPRE